MFIFMVGIVLCSMLLTVSVYYYTYKEIDKIYKEIEHLCKDFCFKFVTDLRFKSVDKGFESIKKRLEALESKNKKAPRKAKVGGETRNKDKAKQV